MELSCPKVYWSKSYPMAEINPAASGRKHGRPASPRVDLTPMVDLGFLLITFFMYTTSLARPSVMELQTPDRQPQTEGPQIPAESSLILIPAAGDRVAYYKGLQSPEDSLAWCRIDGDNGLRSLLQKEQSRVRQLPASFSKAAHELHVLIKPDTSADFEDVVRVLDEMSISAVPHSTLMQISPAESEALKKFQAAAYGM